MSYPIRLKIRRVNAIFGLILIITICSFMSSFSVVSEECMEKGFVCSTKYIYRISIMVNSILCSWSDSRSLWLEIYWSATRSKHTHPTSGTWPMGCAWLPALSAPFCFPGSMRHLSLQECRDLSGWLQPALSLCTSLPSCCRLTDVCAKKDSKISRKNLH